METVFGKFYERLDKPFIITYLTAFVIFHWQFFYILLTTYVSVPDNTNRLEFALSFFSQYGWYSYLTPLFIAMLLIVVIPVFNFATVYISSLFNRQEKIHLSKMDADLHRINSNNVNDIRLFQQKKLNQLKQISDLINNQYVIYGRIGNPDEVAERFYDNLSLREKRDIAKILFVLGELNKSDTGMTDKFLNLQSGNLQFTDFAKDFINLFSKEDEGKTKYEIIKVKT